jgi:hypothetical protein
VGIEVRGQREENKEGRGQREEGREGQRVEGRR